MSIRTIPFECGGLWNESFPELLVQSCTVDPATYRLGPPEIGVRVRVRVRVRVTVRG